MKLTTGYDFQGYLITDYLDVLFDESLVGLGFGKSIRSSLDNAVSAITGGEATVMIEKLNEVKKSLRDRVIQKAKSIGANALIGIDFESSRLGDLIMVSMTATAVKIDRITDPMPNTELADKKKQAEEAAKAEAMKQEAEQQQRLEEIHSKVANFDRNAFLADLRNCESTKEAYDHAIASGISFENDVLKKMQECVTTEQIFGKGSGKRKLVDIIRGYIGA